MQDRVSCVQAVLDEERTGSELAPLAHFEMKEMATQKLGKIVLQGAIAGPSAAALSCFLEAIASYPVTRWTIDMKNLPVLSLGGLCLLSGFAKTLHRRGMVLEVCGVHRRVYANLQHLNLVHLFAWADNK